VALFKYFVRPNAAGPRRARLRRIRRPKSLYAEPLNGEALERRLVLTGILGEEAAAIVATAAATVPAAPSIQSAVAGNGSITITWGNSSNGGSAITSYTVQTWISGNPSSSGTRLTVPSSSRTATVTGLSNGTAYRVAVAANNAVGQSDYSPATVPLTPSAGTTPLAPAWANAAAGVAQATITWGAPTSDGGSAVTGYNVQFRESANPSWQTWAPSPVSATSPKTATITQLTNGTSYVFRVAAVSNLGIGQYTSTAAVTPATTPGPASGINANPGNGMVTVSWTPPADNGGAPITDYTVEYALSTGSFTAFVDGTSTVPSLTVTGLTNGTSYRFRVLAINWAGTSYSTVVTATPATVPGTTRSESATPGNSQVGLKWTIPATDGGNAITDYVVQYANLGGPLAGDTNRDGLVDILDIGTLMSGGKFDSGNQATWEDGDFNGDGVLDVLDVGDLVAGGSFDQGSYISVDAPSWTNFPHTASAAAYATVPNLVNGSFYVFRVAAANAYGVGPWSGPIGPISPTSATAPDTPTGVTGIASDSSVRLSWTAPASNGSPITDYTVQYSSTGGTSWATLAHAPSATPSATITGLANGTAYVFRVAALNSLGTSSWSGMAGPTVPASVPDSPAAPSVSAGNAKVVLFWSQPASNGSAITDYAIQYSSNVGATWTTFPHTPSTSVTATVTGLVNGTAYVFRVAAVNSIGTGVFSAISSTATPSAVVAVPSAPTNVVASPGNGQLTVTWTASSTPAAVASYRVEYSTDSGGTWTTGATTAAAVTSTVVAGLTNGDSYWVRVAAVNADGVAATSSTALPAIPVISNSANELWHNQSPGYAIAIWTAVDQYGVGLGSPVVMNPGRSASPVAYTGGTKTLYLAIASSTNLVSGWYTVVDPNLRVTIPDAQQITFWVDGWTGSAWQVSVNNRKTSPMY
jgi:hypothetical protein